MLDVMYVQHDRTTKKGSHDTWQGWRKHDKRSRKEEGERQEERHGTQRSKERRAGAFPCPQRWHAVSPGKLH